MSLYSFWRNLWSKKVVHVPIDRESLTEYNINTAILNAYAESKGEVAQLKKEIQQRRESEKDIEEEEQVKRQLHERKRTLEDQKNETYFSFGKFFRKLMRDKKFRDNLHFTSFDRKARLAKFGDIGLANNGDLVLLEQGNPTSTHVLLRMQKASDIFQSCGGLVYDLESKSMPINLDKDGGYVENVMSYWQGPEIVPDKEGGFKYAKAKKKYLYEFIKEKQNQIESLRTELENAEETNVKLQTEANTFKSANKALESQANVAQKELSKNEEQLSAINKVFSSLTKELAKIRDVNTLAEERIETLESILTKVRKRAESEEIKTPIDDAIELTSRLKKELVGQHVALQMSQIPQQKSQKEVEVKGG